MARIHRQVDVILQNHTQELLAVEGSIAVQGVWNASGPPKIGSVVTKQGSVKWGSLSTEEGVAAEAFIRLGCTKGYIGLHWILPRAADEFQIIIETPPGIAQVHRLTGPNYDYRVVLVTLSPNPRALRRPHPEGAGGIGGEAIEDERLMP